MIEPNAIHVITWMLVGLFLVGDGETLNCLRRALLTLIIAAFVIPACSSGNPQRPTDSQGFFALLEEGMPGKQVIIKMGKPDETTQFVKGDGVQPSGTLGLSWNDIKNGDTVEVWAYRVADGYGTIFIVDSTVVLYRWGNGITPFQFIEGLPQQEAQPVRSAARSSPVELIVT